MKRREFVWKSLGAGAVVAAVPALARAMTADGAKLIPITVYKSPTCGCCGEWVKHMQKNGFDVKVVSMTDVSPVTRDAGVPEKLVSCHTALVGTYVIEGHVPADLVKKMLAEKPKIAGLSVPGMVQGPPGMDEQTKKPYDVIAFDRNGKTSVYAHR
ncbi:MAG: DUF411 domain-containing protein [Proteobacteria bacterium]|nr:DUF411 domain-containing protein [Pseudomonadota bacterium]